MKPGDLCTCTDGILYESRSPCFDTYACVKNCGKVFIVAEVYVTPSNLRTCRIVGTDVAGWISEWCCFEM